MSIVVIRDSHVFYEFNPKLTPAAVAKPGDLVVFYTKDALGGQVKGEDQVLTSIDFSRVNPATGPLYVEGAEPGDALVVRVVSIETGERGVVVTTPGAGALPKLVNKPRTRVCRVHGDTVEFLGYKVPARKMIGVIGVATEESPSTGIPGRHGGNLDTRFITEGSRVVLPVRVPGALLGLGDLHATMGEGEICVAACEVPGSVIVELSVLKKQAPAWPLVHYGDSSYILVSHESVERAVEEAARVAVNVLSLGLGLDTTDAYMLASLVVDIGVSQLVNPRKTVWARIPGNVVPFEGVVSALSALRE